MERKTIADYDPDLLILFDAYVHGHVDRRGFLDRATKFAVGGVTAGMLLDSLSPKFAEAQKANDSPNLPALLGAQEYIPVDSALPNMVNVGPAERARLVKTSLDIAESKGVVGAGYIPKNDIANCTANSISGNVLIAYTTTFSRCDGLSAMN